MGIYGNLMKLNNDKKTRKSAQVASASAESPTPPAKPIPSKQENPPATVVPRHRDTTRATMTPRHHDTTVSRYQDTAIEMVRRAVKEFGKEAATHRFTSEEKKAIADIVYSYGSQGIRTSENEITRVAINFVVNDFRENGKESILARVLKALNE